MNDHESQNTSSPWSIVLLIGLTLVLAAIAIPNFVKARTTTGMSGCVFNQMWMQEAKQQWAKDFHKTSTAEPTVSEILPFLAKVTPMWDGGPIKRVVPTNGLPVCPFNGTYKLGKVGERVSCSESGGGSSFHTWSEQIYRHHYGKKHF